VGSSGSVGAVEGSVGAVDGSVGWDSGIEAEVDSVAPVESVACVGSEAPAPPVLTDSDAEPLGWVSISSPAATIVIDIITTKHNMIVIRIALLFFLLIRTTSAKSKLRTLYQSLSDIARGMDAEKITSCYYFNSINVLFLHFFCRKAELSAQNISIHYKLLFFRFQRKTFAFLLCL
jgi:hypothetical protein